MLEQLRFTLTYRAVTTGGAPSPGPSPPAPAPSPTSTCTDNASCSGWVANGFCTATFYSTAQKQQYCPNACGLCTSSPPSPPAPAPSPTSTCTDNASCTGWVANGFCTSTFYSTAQKQQYCPNACQLCSG
uniref:ShKT domain-containing protein n=1 Tax=Acrobeloides nanus TaxID=290746 RepID=A0A914E2I6_9BILA